MLIRYLSATGYTATWHEGKHLTLTFFPLLPELRYLYLFFQVTDMMVANSHNLIVTVKPANQRNNVVHRGSKTSVGNSDSVGSAGSMGSALSHDSPSPASQSNPITARYDMNRIYV